MFTARPLAAVALASAMALATSSPALAHDRDPGSASTSRYTQVNLVSDVPGMAPVTDPNLVNAWGLTQGPTSPIWVSDNGTDLSTLYNSKTSPIKQSLVVSIEGGAPTGTVFNGNTTAFVVSVGANSAAARFMFAGENGDITAVESDRHRHDGGSRRRRRRGGLQGARARRRPHCSTAAGRELPRQPDRRVRLGLHAGA